MQHKVFQIHAATRAHHRLLMELMTFLVIVLFLFSIPVSAAKRFQNRSLYIDSSEPGDTASYTVAFQYMSMLPVGSVDMLFCLDPIPYHPCVPPPGLDASNAVLSNQSGETGFSILSKSVNHIVLTRPSTMITTLGSSYKFDTIINPSNEQAFSIRLRSHASTDASGPQIDFGSVRGQMSRGVVIETQVPPMLIFCVAEVVEDNCTSTNNNYYTDMGEINAQTTLTAQSQMAVGTNATAGFVITVNGATLSAGTSVIDPLSSPTPSMIGLNQFGINLVANNEPTVGNDPEGIWANAVPSPDYAIPNRFLFKPGDVIASSPNVSLMKKFTVSYVLNASKDLKPGVYATTITYIASGRF